MDLIKLFEEVYSSAEQYNPLLKMTKAHKKYSGALPSKFSYGINAPEPGFSFRGDLGEDGSVSHLQIILRVEKPNHDHYIFIFNEDIIPGKTAPVILDFTKGEASYEDLMEFAKENLSDSELQELEDTVDFLGDSYLKESFNNAEQHIVKEIKDTLNKNKGISSYLSNVNSELPNKISQYYHSLWNEWKESGDFSAGNTCEVLFPTPGSRSVTWQKSKIKDIKETNGKTMILATLQDSERSFYIPLERCRPIQSRKNKEYFDSPDSISQFIKGVPDTTGYDFIVGLADFY